ncbi:hypothetical protein ACE1TF_19290 [Geomicrobium sp. JSM 1781026]|uniref:hypothetical protein n=1 Tax=Geomicrobium sp. JSM 1781026 TaxID=3344580 RepID=UPI0035C25227
MEIMEEGIIWGTVIYSIAALLMMFIILAIVVMLVVLFVQLVKRRNMPDRYAAYEKMATNEVEKQKQRIQDQEALLDDLKKANEKVHAVNRRLRDV